MLAERLRGQSVWYDRSGQKPLFFIYLDSKRNEKRLPHNVNTNVALRIDFIYPKRAPILTINEKSFLDNCDLEN